MIFVNGFVHCDPHPGNVLVRKCPKSNKTEIVLLDHGLYQVRHRPRPPQTRHRSKFITYYTPLFTRWLPGQLRTQAYMRRSRLKAFHLSGPEALVCFKKRTWFPPPSYYKQICKHTGTHSPAVHWTSVFPEDVVALNKSMEIMWW